MDNLPPITSVTDTAPLGFALVDATDGRIMFANPAFEVLLGANSLKDTLLASVMGDEALIPIFDRTLSFDYEFSILPQGHKTERNLNIRADRMQEHGKTMYALWLLDISAQRQSEQKLRDSAENSKKIAEMRSNLLATMSHEMRTPMQAVYGFLELIAQENLPMHVQEMITNAKIAGSGLLEILDDVLDLAKLEADRMELDLNDVEPRRLIQSILDSLAVRRTNQNIALRLDVAAAVPEYIKIDPKRLKQILVNLAGNALKFTKQGHVVIRCSATQSNPLRLRFEVIDSGIGLSSEAQARLFQPFMQADNTTTRKFGGTGLGLSICKKLVALMEGTIGVESVEGQGSTFWFELPTSSVDAASITNDIASLDGISVLVVEDMPEVECDIIQPLKNLSADVEYSDNYAESLQILSAKPYDIAIFDQSDANAGAVEFMKIVAELRPNTGLILYTAHDNHTLQHTLKSFGANWLPKPASNTALSEAILSSVKKGAVENILANGKRLLIAEDTAMVRDIIKRQLFSLSPNLPVDFVEDGEKAYAALQTGNYSILITDLHMPEMDGYMLVKTIRDAERDKGSARLPIIVLTADVQMAQRQTYMREGFDACILKPVTLSQLSHMLSRWGMQGDAAVPAVPQTILPPDSTPVIHKPAIDLDALAAQMGAVDAGTVEMIAMFPDMTAPQWKQLLTAVKNNDARALTEAAHSIKGAARSACFMTLGDIASDLQDNGPTKPVLENHALVNSLLAEFGRVRAELNDLKTRFNVG